MNKKLKDGFFITTVKDHTQIKNDVMSSIDSMGVHNIIETGQRLLNTDWHLRSDLPRPYWQYTARVVEEHLLSFKEAMGYVEDVLAISFWFQQYGQEDFHAWHTHSRCNFSSVYYVDLPNGASNTSFRIQGQEFEVHVSEGQILTFPSFYSHCSKPNQHGVKTSIAFNSVFNN